MWNKSQDRWNGYRSLKVMLTQTDEKKKRAQSTIFGTMDGRTQEATISSDGDVLGFRTVDGHPYMKMGRKMLETFGGMANSAQKGQDLPEGN